MRTAAISLISLTIGLIVGMTVGVILGGILASRRHERLERYVTDLERQLAAADRARDRHERRQP